LGEGCLLLRGREGKGMGTGKEGVGRGREEGTERGGREGEGRLASHTFLGPGVHKPIWMGFDDLYDIVS